MTQVEGYIYQKFVGASRERNNAQEQFGHTKTSLTFTIKEKTEKYIIQKLQDKEWIIIVVKIETKEFVSSYIW